MDTPAPPSEPTPITAHISIPEIEAALLGAHAARRQPEDLELEHTTGKLALPPTERAPVEWRLFDGPGDLAGRTKGLLQGMGGGT